MMNEWIGRLTEFLGPAGSSTLGHALVGLAILIVGLFVVRILASLAKSLLVKASTRFDDSDGGIARMVSPIASLLKSVLTVFVLIAVLEHFKLESVLEPLKTMTSEFTAAVPNMIGAGVVAYAGWIIAKIVAEIAHVALRKVDDKLIEKTGSSDLRIAKLGSAFLFGAILLPVIVAALGVLNIPAISGPASEMIAKLMAAVPNIIGAGVILLVAYFVAKFVVFMVSGLLEGIRIDTLPEKLGVASWFRGSFTPARLVGSGIMFFSMLSAATAAVDVLKIDVISQIFGRGLEFGGGILIGSVILIVGNILGSIAHRKLAQHAAGLANIARFAILGLVLAMGLKAMGLADSIVTMAFGFTLGSVAVATALAFGLGGREAAKSLADDWARKIKQTQASTRIK